MMTTCTRCGESVMNDPPEKLRYEVVGWEKPRSKGGTNALELRRRTGAVMHDTCMLAQKAPVQGERLF